MGLNELEQLGGWPGVLGLLVRREEIGGDMAAAALRVILEGEATDAQIAAFITLLHAKGETVDELAAMVRTMLELAEPIPLPSGLSTADVIDTCSTGGSPQRRIGAFNVSTISSFVVAGAGAKVTKHGGPAATATSSSAGLMEELGVQIALGPAGVKRCLSEAGMAFCFAPRFHAAARHARPVRGELRVPTIFNFVNALSNPVRPRRQILGVSSPPLAETMLGVMQANGSVSAMVVFGHDGLDELTVTTTSTAIQWRDGEQRTMTVDPGAVGVPLLTAAEVRGGDPAENAALARRVLDGERIPHREVVVLNAAAGIVVAGLCDTLADGVEAARAAIDDGRAASVLERLVAASQAAAEAGETWSMRRSSG